MPIKSKEVNTTFAEKVKMVVSKIPPGKVLTYKNVAKLAGNEKAFRAVATMMKKNHDLAIPCHRVIKSNGEVGEYNRGEPNEKLRRLLKEGWNQQL